MQIFLYSLNQSNRNKLMLKWVCKLCPHCKAQKDWKCSIELQILFAAIVIDLRRFLLCRSALYIYRVSWCIGTLMEILLMLKLRNLMIQDSLPAAQKLLWAFVPYFHGKIIDDLIFFLKAKELSFCWGHASFLIQDRWRVDCQWIFSFRESLLKSAL